MVLFRLGFVGRRMYTWPTIQGRKTLHKKLSRELPEKTEMLNRLTRKLAGWAVDTHTCQQSQQEAKVERKRGKPNLNAV